MVLAEAMAKQESAALPYLQRKVIALDEWTRRKAIQKGIESRRISSTHEGTGSARRSDGDSGWGLEITLSLLCS